MRNQTLRVYLSGITIGNIMLEGTAICPECNKAGLPDAHKCWNCGKILKAHPVGRHQTDTQKLDSEDVIMPCALAQMTFVDRMFAHSLLFKGELQLAFCTCPVCKKAFKELLALLNDREADSDENISEAYNTELAGLTIDLSEFNL